MFSFAIGTLQRSRLYSPKKTSHISRQVMTRKKVPTDTENEGKKTTDSKAKSVPKRVKRPTSAMMIEEGRDAVPVTKRGVNVSPATDDPGVALVADTLTVTAVGPPTKDLKNKFKAQQIPLQGDFWNLIDIADCGRKAVGLVPDADGSAPGPGMGMQLDATGRLAVLPRPHSGVVVDESGVGVKLEPNKGLVAGTAGLAVDLTKLIPVGTIIMFSGSAPIPPGWKVCNGANNTPDLTDKFIIGVSPTHRQDTSYNQPTTSTTSATLEITTTVAPTALTLANLPPHSHTVKLNSRRMQDPGNSTSPVYWPLNDAENYPSLTTSNAGSGTGHTHTALSSATPRTHNHSIPEIYPPKFYALTYLIYMP